jgi:adenine-specific DNA methylase
MIPRECKRLAEVDFPIAAVSKHAVREKLIRDGHPSTLHLWWARRPLASSRAVLMALLLPDPCDARCPERFREAARRVLLDFRRRPQRWDDQAMSSEGLRRLFLEFIADFANWDHASNRDYVDTARALVRAAHGQDAPLVVDPFAGGGSIPLEALRLGCEAFASDLNPVATMILKVMLEDIPRHGPALAEELRRVGGEIKRQAEADLADLYPKDPDGAAPIAYLWARTVRCEAPKCGAEIPLVRSFWLCKKASRRRALKPSVIRPRGQAPRVELEIFEPASESDLPRATVSRAKAACPACNIVLRPERVRAQLADQRGGADVVFDEEGHRVGGARLLAVVTLRPGETGRHYRLPVERDYEAVRVAHQRLRRLLNDWEHGGRQGPCPVPDEPLPPIGTLGFRVQRYGMLQWGDLFTARQKVALHALARSVGKEPGAAQQIAALALGKTADLSNAGAPWKPDRDCPVHMLSSQKIPPFWDWAEAVVVADSSGSFSSACNRSAATLEGALAYPYRPATVQNGDAATSGGLPDESVGLWFTDPPYYDAVPYADLSDFFLVWLKRALPGHPVLRDPSDQTNPLSPKRQEAVQDETKKHDGRIKDRSWFEETMARAFAEGRRVLSEDGVGSVVFAHKTTEGWEALLSGMIRGGWTITGSWPIATEMGSRLRARDSAALATSVHLICRPRPDDAPVADWGDVLRELPRRVGDWMEHLQAEGVRGADLVFACIGPAIEIYSRYSKVVDAEEREIPLGGDPEATEPHKRGFLAYVWEVIGRMALEQILGTAEARARNGAAGAVEEDARLTALFLWTLQATDGAVNGNGSDADSDEVDEGGTDDEDEGDEEASRGRKQKGFSLVFDVVRRFAQPLGIHLPEWEGRIIETEKGVVRLRPVSARAQQLFGEGGATALADRLEQAREPKTVQLSLFTDEATPPPARGRGGRAGGAAADVPDGDLRTRRQATTLDRVHAAMLLQSAGRASALRSLLQAEVERGPDFVRLANSLSALYPRDSEEKRLVDAMLLAVPR